MSEVAKKMIVDEENLLLKALILVNELFRDKFDKEGVPYMNHLYYVSDNLETVEEKVVGLLHDSIEDTELTYSDLLELGFPVNIANSVMVLTRNKEMDYSLYIDNVLKSKDMVAIRVKQVDMTHNMNKKRLSHLEEKERQRLILKYKPQYRKIENYLKER